MEGFGIIPKYTKHLINVNYYYYYLTKENKF